MIYNFEEILKRRAEDAKKSRFDSYKHFANLKKQHQKGVNYAKCNKENLVSVSALFKVGDGRFDICIDTAEDKEELDWFGKMLVDVLSRMYVNYGNQVAEEVYVHMVILRVLDVFEELKRKGLLWFITDIKNPVCHLSCGTKIMTERIQVKSYSDWHVISILAAYDARGEENLWQGTKNNRQTLCPAILF